MLQDVVQTEQHSISTNGFKQTIEGQTAVSRLPESGELNRSKQVI